MWFDEFSIVHPSCGSIRILDAVGNLCEQGEISRVATETI